MRLLAYLALTTSAHTAGLTYPDGQEVCVCSSHFKLGKRQFKALVSVLRYISHSPPVSSPAQKSLTCANMLDVQVGVLDALGY